MEKEIAIKIEGVSKRYTIGKNQEDSLRGTISNLFKSNVPTETFWALQDISFEIKKGDVIGIIGRNGAGKSTLLKVLSKITYPTNGRIEINGRVASLLEVGTGFHPELTGRENIFLNGTILGMSRSEVKAKFDEIVEFSGVEKFINTPVKHYSSGMYVRLAFAVAAHLEPEILIIDEVLAVGDAEFQKKCLGKMKHVANTGRTVLFVSHNLAAVESLCNRGVVLNKGEMVFNGSTKDAINNYYKLVNSANKAIDVTKFSNENISVKSFSIAPPEGDIITVNSGARFELEIENKRANESIDATFELRNHEEVIVFHRGTLIDAENGSKKGRYRITGELPPNMLNAGSYTFHLMFGLNSTYLLLACPEILSFDVENSPDENGYKLLPGMLKPILNFNSECLTHE